MAGPRIFISYAQESAQDSQFAHQLIADLRKAELEPVMLEDQQHPMTEENFAQALNEKLLECEWVLLVQTPEAVLSPHVQLTINTALNLTLQKRIRGVIAMIRESVPTQEIPPTWTTLRTFDASADYSRALARLLLALQPSLSTSVPTMRVQAAPPPIFHPPTIETPAQVTLPGPATPTPLISEVSDRPLPASQASWFRYRAMPRRRWLLPLVVGLVVVLIITISMTALARDTMSSDNQEAVTPTRVSFPSVLPTATPNAGATATNVAAATVTAQNAAATATALDTRQRQITATQAALGVNVNNNKIKPTPAPTPTPVLSPEMRIYRDAMQQPLMLNSSLGMQDQNNWDANLATGSCRFTGNGSYDVKMNSTIQANSGLQFALCIENSSQFSNFAFQTQMALADNASDCGLTFRAKGATQYSYRFYINNAGFYQFYGYPDNAGNIAQPLTGQTNVMVPNQRNTITVIAINGDFYVYVNGNFITHEPASAFGQPNGSVGMGCRLDGQVQTSEAFFQSAKVWKLQ